MEFIYNTLSSRSNWKSGKTKKEKEHFKSFYLELYRE